MAHWKGFSFVWVTIWAFRWDLHLNAFWQTSQEYGRSFSSKDSSCCDTVMWVKQWTLYSVRLEQEYLHELQEKDFSDLGSSNDTSNDLTTWSSLLYAMLIPKRITTLLSEKVHKKSSCFVYFQFHIL